MADIKGFFDNVSHDALMRFLAHRLHDPVLLRIIRRWLKAGVLDAGVFAASETGTPQGGRVSPVLANIDLHYVLDVWFEKRYARTCTGRADQIRYADDFVACFTHEVEPSKTRLIRFGSRAAHDCKKDGIKRPPTFAYRVSGLLFKWLNRRSQRQGVTWERFSQVLSVWMPSLRIQHNLYPKPLWMTQAGSRMV